jgi:two-component system chemotaxis response regulator CheB
MSSGVISVLVVDDSALIRRVVTDALTVDPGVTVVGTAANGKLALAMIEQLKPDLVTLDIEMPVLTGLQTLPLLRQRWPRLPVIMFSTVSEAGAIATLTALSLGASDYVTKPSNTRNFEASRRSVQEQLLPRIHALCGGRSTPAGPPPAPARPAAPTRPAAPAGPAAAHPKRVEIVALGASTGGPEALTKLLAGLPPAFPVPILVVQHMPALFTRMFAQRLDRAAALTVVEATDRTPLQPGTVYIAPGDRHLEVDSRGGTVHTRLTDGPAENFCRPSVDVLFRSVAAVYGGGAAAVVLTGMGSDGRRGAEVLRTAAAEMVAQDEPTSVVWGMPGAVVGAGLATAVLPLQQIAAHLVSSTARGRSQSAKEMAS